MKIFSHPRRHRQRFIFQSGFLRLAICFVAGLFVLAAPLLADDNEPGKIETYHADTRGFGDINVTLRTFGEKAESSWTTLAAQDAAHAQVCASKRLADLLGFGDLKEVTDRSLPGTLLELKDTGFWLLGVEGASFHELYAPNKNALMRLEKQSNAALW